MDDAVGAALTTTQQQQQQTDLYNNSRAQLRLAAPNVRAFSIEIKTKDGKVDWNRTASRYIVAHFNSS